MSCGIDVNSGQYIYFVFFKQKTAYEIRPRDWSSDVCSSDLGKVVGNADSAALIEVGVSPLAGTGQPQLLGWHFFLSLCPFLWFSGDRDLACSHAEEIARDRVRGVRKKSGKSDATRKGGCWL